MYVCICVLIPLAFIKPFSLSWHSGSNVQRVSICGLEFLPKDAAAELSTAPCNLLFKTLRGKSGKCDTKFQFRLWRTRGLQTSCLYYANREMLIGLELKDTWINAIYLRRVNIASVKSCLKQTSWRSLKGSTKLWIRVV